MRKREEMPSMKVLVTGGAGFIGSNVVDGLIEAGHQVLVVDNLTLESAPTSTPKHGFLSWISVRRKPLN